MLKGEAISALHRISNLLRCLQLPGDPNLDCIFDKIKDLIDAKSKYDDLADLISDYRQAIELGQTEDSYSKSVFERIFKRGKLEEYKK